MIDILIYLVLIVVSLAAVALNVVSLPGNWIILLAALALSIGHNGHHPPWWVLVIILVILLLAEGAEFASGMVGTKVAGGSKAASWAALGGAVLGGLIGFPPLTVPMLGIDHLLMAIFGAFMAAWCVELALQRTMGQSLKSAVGAALGRGAGLFAKISAGLVAWAVLALGYWLPW